MRFYDLQEPTSASGDSLRFFQLEVDYQNSVGQGLFWAVTLHLLLLLSGGVLVQALRVEPQEVAALGYEGPTRTLEELEILEPNSVQSYFYQRMRRGMMASPEYAIVEPVDVDPGPEPIPVRQLREKPKEEVVEFPENVELVEPLKAYRREISLTSDFVILKAVKPHYPEYEKQRGIQARVEVAIFVFPNGDIDDPPTITGVQMDPPGASSFAFESSVIEAVKQWKIKPNPERAHGQWIKIPIRFDSNDITSPVEASW